MEQLTWAVVASLLVLIVAVWRLVNAMVKTNSCIAGLFNRSATSNMQFVEEGRQAAVNQLEADRQELLLRERRAKDAPPVNHPGDDVDVDARANFGE